ncbi:unnamed protein product [Rotaria magnacalcarata]|uniref:Ubiquitin-like domain-containing protein n=1 Tax=Rotaria magnacalcarata TaxID=392030 RepID=A0A819N581_9BILA|nr:unnamed protein product [Rotaria magnacalcarata]
MHIFIILIRTKQCLPQGDSNKPLLIDIDPSLTIKNVKEKISQQIGVPSCDQFLSFEGRILEDEQTLASAVRVGCGSNPNDRSEILSEKSYHSCGDLRERFALAGQSSSGRGSSRQTAHGIGKANTVAINKTLSELGIDH